MLLLVDGPNVSLSAGVNDTNGCGDFDGTELPLWVFLAILGEFLTPVLPVGRRPVIPCGWSGFGPERLYLVLCHSVNVLRYTYRGP